ncbi:hypothetical protein C2S51_038828, partial [Perilla frutescens var. frutescens]
MESDVELPSLRKVEIERCPNMKYLTLGFLAAPNLKAFETDLNNYRQVPYDNQKLTIWEYKGSMSLFRSSTAENLVSLRELLIHRCDEMELELYCLPKLVSFCEWKCDVELPSLRKVEIEDCPNMKYFMLGILTTPELKSIEIDYKDFGGVKDLNDTLHQHYLAQEK